MKRLQVLELNLDARQLVSKVGNKGKKEIFSSVGLNRCVLPAERNYTAMLVTNLEGSSALIFEPLNGSTKY